MKDIELCDVLESLEYSLRGRVAMVGGIHKRIVDEWILKKPAGKMYGRPSVMLSKPLSQMQVKEMLAGLSENLQGDIDRLHRIKENV